MIKNQKSRKLKTENQYGKISDFFVKNKKMDKFLAILERKK